MGVVDAGGCISATRYGAAMFEWSQHIYMMFLIASWECRGVGVEVRCGGGGRGRVYLRNPTWDSNV